MDEVPCNSDSGYIKMFFGRSTGNWNNLKQFRTNLMMSLKPVEEGGNIALFDGFIEGILFNKKMIDLSFPNHLAVLKLDRIFRCTTNIAKFHEATVMSIKKSDFHFSPKINIKSTSYTSGHEIYGELPEILLLPQCICFDNCYIPMTHLFLRNISQIISFIKRVLQKTLTTELNIIVNTSPFTRECIIYLRGELERSNLSSKVIVKDIDKCRGLEYPVLMTITNDANRGARTHGDSYVIDAWTRVTSSLFIIHMEGKYGKLTRGLKNSIKNQVAKNAKEQQTITYTSWKELYIFLQHPFFIPILIPINIVRFLLMQLIVWLLGLK